MEIINENWGEEQKKMKQVKYCNGCDGLMYWTDDEYCPHYSNKINKEQHRLQLVR